MKFNFKLFSSTLILLFITTSIFSQDEKKLEGRWDLVISKDGAELPSWLEVRHSGHKTLVGRFVYAFGSARPVSHIKVKDGKFSFAIPPQWEAGERNMEFEGKLVGEELTGTMKYTDGKMYNWSANRAPKLASVENPIWGAPREIFNQKNLAGWHASGENQWVVENGILTSKKSGSNLITDEKFSDFKLHLEFRYPKEGNSGVYLRGRYEVQVADNKRNEPSDIMFGGVYGFLTPNEMVAKSAGEWQAFDITLIGRRVTIVANGKTIISDQIIPGITGGALDSREGEPGPFMLQGDHGPIEYRNIVVTPLLEK
jgi:hypothetical protein